MWERLTLASTVTFLLYIFLQFGGNSATPNLVLEESLEQPSVISFLLAKH